MIRLSKSKIVVLTGVLVIAIAVGTLAVAFVVGAKSKDEVTEFVRALPASSIIQWKVTPLETFAHLADIEKKVVQGLRAQK